MDGQVLGGGVIVLVAVVLWLVYLVPSWHSRARYNASERNAARLGRALRVLAETNEEPEEVRVELETRAAHRAHRLAQRKRKLAGREEAERHRAELEEARRRLQLARATPSARRARARRRGRLTATVLLLGGVLIAAAGGWTLVTGGGQVLLWGGGALLLVGLVALGRANAVGRRGVAVAAPEAEEAAAPRREAGPLIDADRQEREWTPRALPAPMVTVAGSRAATARAGAEARTALLKAAHDEAMRERAARLRPDPVSIGTARSAAGATRPSPADDAEIEAHVRRLLASRAAG